MSYFRRFQCYYEEEFYTGLPDGKFSCQKYPNLGIISRALEWIMLVYFMSIWNILPPFGIIEVIWYTFFWFWYGVPKNLETLI
jgi:hypothetical protein